MANKTLWPDMTVAFRTGTDSNLLTIFKNSYKNSICC